MRRALLYVGGWLAAVVIATGVGFAAVSLVGDDVGAPGAAVALVATPQPSATPSDDGDEGSRPTRSSTPRETDPTSSSTSSPSITITRATSFSDAATVNGQCRGTTPRLTSWSPKNGWSVVDTELSGTVRHIAFSDGNAYVTVTLRCVGKVATFSVTTADASPSPDPTQTPEPTPSETFSIDPGGTSS